MSSGRIVLARAKDFDSLYGMTEEQEVDTGSNGDTWIEDYVTEGEESDSGVIDYDLSVIPNDFNVSTLYNFIEAGTIIVPGFQRHYVWSIKQASELIESLILGLPVPQLFLYEKARNRFLVIDGHQRLMSIYFFIKQRFPRKEVRAELRRIFAEKQSIPDEVLRDKNYFTDFRLQLPTALPGRSNPLSGASYDTLGDFQFQFDLRPLRNVVIRQNAPPGDNDSSIFEIFGRLNSGEAKLTPQEIRLSLYHSEFYDMLMRMNTDERWRSILGNPVPDLHLKDVEVLLRIFAMLVDGEEYSPSMVKFLNQFSRKCQKHDRQWNKYLESLLDSFLNAARDLPKGAFSVKETNKFSIALIEAAFTAACANAFAQERIVEGLLDTTALQKLKEDEEFLRAASLRTTNTASVRARLGRGKYFIEAL